jgi:predicted nuclease with TOPRIM domain
MCCVRFLQFKESISNIDLIQEMINEDKQEVQDNLKKQYELEEELAALKARGKSFSTRKRARIVSNNIKVCDEYEEGRKAYDELLNCLD